MKVRIQMDEELDLGNCAIGEYATSLEEEIVAEIKNVVKGYAQDLVRKKLNAELKKWVSEEFGKEGKLQVRDGVVYIPLMLEKFK